MLVTNAPERLRDATMAFFNRLSGGEMRLVHVLGHPQGVGRDRQTGVQTGAGRKERGVHDVEVVDFVGPVLWVEHAGFGIGAKAARAADVAQGSCCFRRSAG